MDRYVIAKYSRFPCDTISFLHITIKTCKCGCSRFSARNSKKTMSGEHRFEKQFDPSAENHPEVRMVLYGGGEIRCKGGVSIR